MTVPRDRSAAAVRARRMAPADRRLLAALLLPAVAWAAHLLVVYGSSELGRRSGSRPLTVVVTLVALGLCLGGLYLARLRPRHGAAPDSDREARNRFLSDAALILGAFFAATIFAQSAPLLVFSPEGP